MCWLKRLVKPPVYTIPYPEESPDLNATTLNTSVPQTLDRLFSSRNTQFELRAFWFSITYELVDNLHVEIDYGSYVLSVKVAAAAYSELLLVKVDPHYCNPGVLGHENAHIEFYFLSDELVAEWPDRLEEAVQLDPLLSYLWNLPERSYMRSDIIEAHADVYRFLGDKVPLSLWKFYPHLL